MTLECGYCLECVLINDDDVLMCDQCQKNIHLKCLKHKTPGDLQGDVFFNFTCSNCADDKESNTEIFVRNKLLW